MEYFCPVCLLLLSFMTNLKWKFSRTKKNKCSLSDILADLLETCPDPWTSYRTIGTLQGVPDEKLCLRKCSGHAFHTENGKRLICFHKILTSDHNSTLLKNDGFCDCGIITKKFDVVERHWLQCTPRMLTLSVTKKRCREICDSTAVYVRIFRNKKTVVHCEANTRQMFYKMFGSLGELEEPKMAPIRKQGGPSRFRSCNCGIKNLDLVRQNYSAHPNNIWKPSQKNLFDECSKPWHPLYMPQIADEICAVECLKMCGKSRGFHYHGRAICFHRSVDAKMKTDNLGREKDICECGVVRDKRIQEIRKRIFFSCNPPVKKSLSSSRDCQRHCNKVTAYHMKHFLPTAILCIAKNESVDLVGKSLSAKCDKRVYSGKKSKYRLCRCGLLRDSKTSQNEITNFVDLEKSIPYQWTVRRKRTQKQYAGKQIKRDEIEIKDENSSRS